MSWGTGGTWLDPYNRDNHAMIVELSREAEAMGFDEIQLDYVRFPVDDGTQYAAYPSEDGTPRPQLLIELLSAIEDREARIVATAERALLDALDGSCRTPVGSYAVLQPDGDIRLTGLVASEDGTFVLRRVMIGAAADAARIGTALGESLKRGSPADIFLD